ncbi:MAG TPA: amidase family protein [Dehalococcoidia bacterium]
MDLKDLWQLDATGQAAFVRSGDVQPAELVELAISRVDRIDPHLNSVVTKLYDDARAAANEPHAGPFAGVPIFLKDASIQVEGTPHYVGTRVLRNIGYRSRRTTELARRLLRAGFIVLGKTNVPELSSGITTEPPGFAATKNPWDATRSPGGSSGGSAAAVAAGFTAIAHGADSGGSLRYPSACCGVVTLKPSRGRVPSDAPCEQPDPTGLGSEFVIARSVRDLQNVLRAVENPAVGAAHAQTESNQVEQLRVGLLTRDVMTGMSVDARCAEAVEHAGRLLEARGHIVEMAHPPALDGLFVRMAPAFPIAGAVARRGAVEWLARAAGRELTPDDLSPVFLEEAQLATTYTAEQVADAEALIAREAAPILDWWSAHDILVTPTLRQPAWLLGSSLGAGDAGTFPFAFSLTGQPAMSVPLAHVDGLPVGVQLVGAIGADELLLRLAAQLEAIAPWADRWPAIALD